jgi:hypothetical protein
MKNAILGLFVMAAVVSLPGYSKSEEARVIYDNEATFSIPAKGVAGGYVQITIDNKDYAVEATNSVVQKELTDLVGAHQFHKVARSGPGKVVGFFIKEKGHMPNPVVVMEVFKIISMNNYSLPKGIER